MSAKLSMIIVVVVILLAAFVTTNHAAVREMTQAADAPSVKGDLKYSYRMFYPDGSKSQASDQPCSSIEFHSGYVVVRDKDGGKVIPVSSMESFRWSGK